MRKYRLIIDKTRWAKNPEDAKKIFRKALAKMVADPLTFDVETDLSDDETGEEF